MERYLGEFLHKKKIDLRESINTLGITKVQIKLFEGVIGEVKVELI